ncbi:tetratricopeptide repeat protein [Myxococcota bacterium]
MRNYRIPILLGVACVFCADSARAQSIDEALRLYKKKDYEDAAFVFYDVLQKDANPDHRDQAEIYLAETLRKLDMLVPALFYYTDLFKAGRSNRYYLNAVEGLLRIQQRLHDPLWVPALINELLDPEGFGQLDPDKIAQINYLVGELSFRQRKNQDARAFLEYVPPESPLHPKARYLLGMLDVRADDPEGAQKHFESILDIIDQDESEPELRRVRNLALLAAGRNAYGLGKFDDATNYYRNVPRFSRQWFTAMYENAWAHFRTEAYGRALGELQSITSPYFSRRFIPEAYVIRGTTYFVSCQWDRVRRSVERYKKIYEPMLGGLKGYLEEGREPAEFYRDVVAGGGGRFSIEVAREVRRSKRFKDYHFMLSHMTWERDQVDKIDVWRGSRLAEDVSMILDQHRDATEQVVGTWAKRRLAELHAQLNNFQNQVNVLDFEVADAERQWLEQGKEILKGRRARLPRPDIPDDQWQHWSFDREYWKDELGYIQHSLRSECF